ncbi:MAG: GNAT family protein [Anaerolineales bacterium]|jgi:RimJ/RimL family protein N-acetyltransferase|nr:GNAT family protein [Anaerolineales bacterium]
MGIQSVTLEGRFVRIEPLSKVHIEGLCRAISDGELWKLLVAMVPHPDNIDEYLSDAHNAYKTGIGLAFATIDKAANRVAGSTRFMRADLPNTRIEIGFTFLGKTWQKTPINTESKFLMLSHAFETMGLNRVELRTDYLNSTSRRAILRLGAKEEGLLRNHMVMPNGRVRDSVIYSVIRNDWPGVKQHLSSKLA